MPWSYCLQIAMHTDMPQCVMAMGSHPLGSVHKQMPHRVASRCRAAHAFIKQALAEEPSLGVEVYQQLASPTSGGTVVIVRVPCS